MRPSSATTEELVRARLAYVSAGLPPPTDPRRAVAPDDGDAGDEEGVEVGGDVRLSTPAPPAGWSRFELTRKHVIAAGVLLICGVLLALFAILRTQATEVDVVEPEIVSTPAVSASGAAEPPAELRVHVLGGVSEPGVVMLSEGAIVADAIDAAGGFSEDADPGQLNLAAAVVEGMQVMVGVEGQDSALSTGAEEGGAGAEGAGINLNTATQAQLEELPGVGPVTASAIIAWRERNGGFSSVAQLQEVDGIGPKTFAALQPLVVV